MFNKTKNKAQVIVEFTFCVVITLIMVYGVVYVFQWVGEDQVRRRQQHDALYSIKKPIKERYSSPSSSGVLQQLEPNFYKPVKMNAIFEDAL
jgi:hypothetical protein